MHAGSLRRRLDRDRATGCQSAAATVDQHLMRYCTSLFALLHELKPGGPLAGNDMFMIECRHHDTIFFRGDFAGNGFPVAAVAIV